MSSAASSVDPYVHPSAVSIRARVKWRPPPKLRLSQWADGNFRLLTGSAVPGRWHTLPYQRELLDAMSDPLVEQISIMKSAQVGFTLCMSAAIGYFIAHDPASILVVQPTVDDAKSYSKETIAPMLRDVPALAGVMVRTPAERGPKDPTATLLHKEFPGVVLQLIGANSEAGFRRVTRRVVMFDEVDAYPASAGAGGDPISLGIVRTETFHDRKIIAGSTPLVAGASRIEEMFEAGDQRRYHVPCPSCGHMDILAFEGERGHVMSWPDDHPEAAFFVCKANGCVIEHKDKRWMVERGEWRADKPGGSHRSYHMWSALSYAPNASWGRLAAQFVAAQRGGPEKLRTFFNTKLGQTWTERGEAPDWERLYHRRETYPLGTVPAGVAFLTTGVDVQKDRLVWEVVGWSATKESWSVDAGVLMGDTSDDATWLQLDALLARTFLGEGGREFTIAMMAVDSGYNTQQVYGWCRRHPMNRVIATKGVASARSLVGIPSAVDVNLRGKRMARGYKVWIVGVGLAKGELYGWLRLPRPPAGEPAPPGYCHFPEHDEEYFKQLTAEQLVTVRKRNGYTALEWQLLPNRENHFLDCRIYARAAAAVLGIDRLAPPAPPAPRQPHAPPPQPSRAVASDAPRPPAAATPRPAPAPAPARPSWIRGGRPGSWLGRRR